MSRQHKKNKNPSVNIWHPSSVRTEALLIFSLRNEHV